MSGPAESKRGWPPTYAPDSEMVSFRNDRSPSGMPREGFSRLRDRAPRGSAVFGVCDTTELDIEVWGQDPQRFLLWATKLLRCAPSEILHLCSGALPPGTGRMRVDIRRGVNPDVVADARRLPFASDSFDGVMLDPPFSIEYARDLYGTEYPRPSHLLAEACRVVKPCGRIGFLHFLVPFPPAGCRLESIRGITTGCGYRIQAFTVFEKHQDSLFVEPEPTGQEVRSG
jgi:SAM-dependent methyltransferase